MKHVVLTEFLVKILRECEEIFIFAYILLVTYLTNTSDKLSWVVKDKLAC